MLKVQYRFNTELNSGFTINNTPCTREKKRKKGRKWGEKIKEVTFIPNNRRDCQRDGVHSKFGVSRQLKIF